jgi:Low affinity iron permease
MVRLDLRPSARLYPSVPRDGGMGGDRARFQLQRHLAAGDNTGTTVATFLMIFVLQHSQNRDSTAIQAKLDELIRSSEASNKLIRAERLTETEVEELRP